MIQGWRTNLTRSCVAIVPVALGATALGLAAPSHAAAAASIDTGSWRVEQTFGPTTQGFNAVSCSSSSDCVAVGTGIIEATTDAGSTWNSETVPAGVGALYGISCPSASTCF